MKTSKDLGQAAATILECLDDQPFLSSRIYILDACQQAWRAMGVEEDDNPARFLAALEVFADRLASGKEMHPTQFVVPFLHYKPVLDAHDFRDACKIWVEGDWDAATGYLKRKGDE